MKRGAWDGFCMYENAKNAYQHFANAHVAAHPGAASKEKAAIAACIQEAWNACPAGAREQTTQDLRAQKRQKAASNLTMWVKVAKPKAQPQLEPQQPQEPQPFPKNFLGPEKKFRKQIH